MQGHTILCSEAVTLGSVGLCLLEKGKPIVRSGRKATDPTARPWGHDRWTAGLPRRAVNREKGCFLGSPRRSCFAAHCHQGEYWRRGCLSFAPLPGRGLHHFLSRGLRDSEPHLTREEKRHEELRRKVRPFHQ